MICVAPYINHDPQWLKFSAVQQWSHSLALFGCVCLDAFIYLFSLKSMKVKLAVVGLVLLT